MGHKRLIYSAHKHFWHLNRKKIDRMEYLYNLVEVEILVHGLNRPVDMQSMETENQVDLVKIKIQGGK